MLILAHIHLVHIVLPPNSLDSVGIAGFSFDFGALDGKEALVATAIDNFGKRSGNGTTVSPWMFLLAPVLPILLELPTARTRIVRELKQELSTIGTDLLNRVRKEMEMGNSDDNSIIGLLSEPSNNRRKKQTDPCTLFLVKAEGNDAELYMSSEEIKAQVRTGNRTLNLTDSSSLDGSCSSYCVTWS